MYSAKFYMQNSLSPTEISANVSAESVSLESSGFFPAWRMWCIVKYGNGIGPANMDLGWLFLTAGQIHFCDRFIEEPSHPSCFVVLTPTILKSMIYLHVFLRDVESLFAHLRLYEVRQTCMHV